MNDTRVLKLASLIPHDIRVNISKLIKQKLKLKLFSNLISADPYCTILSNFNVVGQYTAEL